jgi:hypothetical protein
VMGRAAFPIRAWNEWRITTPPPLARAAARYLYGDHVSFCLLIKYIPSPLLDSLVFYSIALNANSSSKDVVKKKSNERKT